ncbi:MAG TPA: FKBP-type peptidyl-prolyl cis-trans isomerase [Hanamia sp.]|nr:FKBP-type peptidyl-prolyl cis-trans isomerase [Hanamia sp.]
MNKSLCLIAMILLFLASGCIEQRFKKDKDGTEYKIIRNSNGQLAKAGDYMELNTVAKYNDSVLFNSVAESAPRFIPYDTAQMPPYFKEVHEGDSLVIRQSTDSILKHGPGAPWMQRGQFITQSFKIVKLFPDKAAADSADKPFLAAAKIIAAKKVVDTIEKHIATDTALVNKDEKEIQDYMAKNNLKGTKTPWGTYVIIDSAGTGPYLTANDVAVVNYTGRTFDDSTFDSNTDKKYNHEQPLYIDMSEYRVIPGWIDGLKLMKKGSVGKFIIPSYLAYGKNGAPPKIAPNSNLVFDIKVTDVVNQEQYQEEMQKQQMQMQMQREMMQQEMQKHEQDMQEKIKSQKKK